MQLNISGVKAFSAHPTSISRYLVADLGQVEQVFAYCLNRAGKWYYRRYRRLPAKGHGGRRRQKNIEKNF
jgi:hypothetical protein